MEFIKRFCDRRPEHLKMYREPIINRFTQIGREDEEARYESGKYFSRIYETFMYAAFLGLRNNYRLPLKGDRQYFIEIRAWQPREMVQYLLMALLAKADLDLNEIEEMEEKQVESELTKLNNLLEEYANGGFDLIYTKVQEEPYFFENEYCFVEMLGDLPQPQNFH